MSTKQLIVIENQMETSEDSGSHKQKREKTFIRDIRPSNAAPMTIQVGKDPLEEEEGSLMVELPIISESP